MDFSTFSLLVCYKTRKKEVKKKRGAYLLDFFWGLGDVENSVMTPIAQ